MLFFINVIKITYLIVTWLCGSILNSSIVAVYLREWKNGMSLGECDRTILTMGCNNLFLQCFLTMNEVITIFELYGLFLKEFTLVGCILYFFLCYVSMWLTAWLSICYYVKLVNFSHRLLIRFKRTIPSASAPFLFGSVVGSCLINVPFIWTMDTEFLQNTTVSAENFLFKMDLRFMSFNVVIGSCVPVLVTSVCMGFSVMSLLRHVQRMKNNTSQSWNPQLQSHVRACRTMSLLMIMNLIFFLAVITVAMGLTKFNDIIARRIIYWLVVMASPSAEAIILILGNTKLKMALPKICF
uniref:Taste receptor type 2 n=1 Tax=Xenopus tropicalis TaxID=8364 RepID=A0A803KKU0_XENTR